jgi:hypothetical protein
MMNMNNIGLDASFSSIGHSPTVMSSHAPTVMSSQTYGNTVGSNSSHTYGSVGSTYYMQVLSLTT